MSQTAELSNNVDHRKTLINPELEIEKDISTKSSGD